MASNSDQAEARDLWGTVAVKVPEVTWLGFRQWALENKGKSVEHANVSIGNYLASKRHQASCSHTVHLYLQAWRSWGIEVSDLSRDQIAQFDREDWRPAQLTRRNEQQVKKLRQFESLDKLWSTMVDYMLDVSGPDFRALLQSVSSNRGGYTAIASSSFNEMEVVARKIDSELRGILCCTLSYASLLRTSGMRGLTGLNVKLGDFTDLGDGSVLLERWEKKLGSTRNVTKPVYCRIVPGVNPRQDPLIHITQHVVTNGIGSGDQVFGFGFQRKDHQDDEAYAKCPQRRFIAVLHAVAISCGSSGGLGERQLHAFRILCENKLGQLGFTSQERADYVGWQGTGQSQAYSLMKSKAVNSIIPYKIAGRDCRDEKPHPMWGLLGDVPVVELKYWHRVYRLAVVTKVTKDSQLVIDKDFQREMSDHLKASAKRRANSTNPVALNKRIRQLERELQDGRSKRARLDLGTLSDSETSTASDDLSTTDSTTTVDPVKVLKHHLMTLKGERKVANFPSQCLAVLPELTKLIDAASTPQRSFGLALSSAEGKDLMRCLYLAALAKRVQKPDKGAARTWFGWADTQHKVHPVLKQIDMRSWQAHNFNIDHPSCS